MKVLVFGAAREIIGEKEISVSLQSNETIGSFSLGLFEKYPALKKLNALAFAVNEEYAKGDVVLNDQDVVALIPPVSGG